jgi:hypothetical protein
VLGDIHAENDVVGATAGVLMAKPPNYSLETLGRQSGAVEIWWFSHQLSTLTNNGLAINKKSA